MLLQAIYLIGLAYAYQQSIESYITLTYWSVVAAQCKRCCHLVDHSFAFKHGRISSQYVLC